MDTSSKKYYILLHTGFAVFMLGLWYGLHYLNPAAIPTPLQVLDALLTQIKNEGLVNAIVDAMYAILTGFFFAAFVGVPFGLLMGLSRYAEQIFDPYLNALYVTPFSALVPALIAWFGTGIQIRIIVCFFFAIFPITINVLEGTKSAPKELQEVVRSFGGNSYHLIRTVILPYEVPYLAAGFRLGIGRAVKGLVISELLIAVTGLGGILTQWSSSFDMSGVFSVVIVLMSMGIILTRLLKEIEAFLIDWEVRNV